MFIQIHTLTGYSGVLLNRDDSGLAKRMPYGGHVRTRTSSQFNKRKIRLADGPYSLQELGTVAVRSRETFKREIAKPIIQTGRPADAVIAATVVLMDAVYPLSDGGKKKRKEKEKEVTDGKADPISLLERDEINVLSRSEIEFLRGKVEDFLKAADKAIVTKEGDEPLTDAERQAAFKAAAAKAATEYVKDGEHKKNLKQVGQSMSLDIAMFGRMVTGDSLSTVDAAIHVAHAITTHAQQTETDFFTAVDDLVTGDGDNGSGHMGETEINSPMLYGYEVVDFRQLLDNLQGLDNAKEVAAQLVGNVIHLVSEHIVGAKKGGTAPYSSADLVIVEIGSGQPRTLAEAFRTPCKPTLENSVATLVKYLEGKDRMYGFTGRRFVSCVLDTGLKDATEMPLNQLSEAIVAALKE